MEAFIIVLVITGLVLWNNQERAQRIRAQAAVARQKAILYESWSEHWWVSVKWIERAFEDFQLDRCSDFPHWSRERFIEWYQHNLKLAGSQEVITTPPISLKVGEAVNAIFKGQDL